MKVAFIPVRGGSKSIPLKNIRPICGKPLVYWTLKAACSCRYIDKVYVSTDSDKIKECVEAFKNGSEAENFAKAEVIGRSAETAVDTASTESAMLEFAQNYDFTDIVLIQATSPLLTGEDLDHGFEAYAQKGTDSVLSVVLQKRFNWARDAAGYAYPSNYDVFNRPRRQDFSGYLVENGAFYITSKERLLKSRNRVSGNIKAVEMNPDTFFEIDEPSDWVIIEALMKKNGLDTTSDTGVKPIPEIKMLLTDCDGCLTDGGMYYSEKGDELKKFNTRDGLGLGLLRNEGVITGIITGENVELNRRRAKKLRLDILEPGCRDKALALRKYCADYSISLENVCFIGDDRVDIPALEIVGFACCPADAMPEVKQVADYISPLKGGEGAVRDICEKILKSRQEKYKK